LGEVKEKNYGRAEHVAQGVVLLYDFDSCGIRDLAIFDHFHTVGRARSSVKLSVEITQQVERTAFRHPQARKVHIDWEHS
jgi:hypothetical protein